VQELERPYSELSEDEKSRLAHNRTMVEAVKEAAGRRRAFVRTNWDQLAPFTDAHVPPPDPTMVQQQQQQDAMEYRISTLQPPAEIKATLRSYQLDGLRWLVNTSYNGTGAILADEMGLGKTLQTIALFATLKYSFGVSGPHLVVVPLSVMSSWMTEFRKWCPSMRVIRLHSADITERERLKAEVLNNVHEVDVVVTTYEMVKSPNMMHTLTSRIHWRYLVLDEGHMIKNEGAQISQVVRKVRCVSALLLTGTPLQNNLHELWAILNFLFAEVFPNSDKFDACFNLSKTSHSVDVQMLSKAHFLLRPFMLRRVKSEVEHSLLDKTEIKIHCPLSKMQLFWYQRLLLKDCNLLESTVNQEKEDPGGKKAARAAAEAARNAQLAGAGELAEKTGPANDWQRLNSLLMQLRKACNHPYLFNDAENVASSDGSASEDIIAVSGKMEVLDRLLQKLKAGGHRVVLFSQFTRMLDIIDDYCVLRGYDYCRLDGGTNRVQRMVDIDRFNQEGSKIFLYLVSTRAGGLGVNLQTADTCILYDSDWNPQVDLQAMARVHRIGQKKKVHVYRLVAKDTVEERVLMRSEKKLFLDQMVNRGSTAQGEELEKLTTQVRDCVPLVHTCSHLGGERLGVACGVVGRVWPVGRGWGGRGG
jgi:SWI/SNF-related matrix-associated actin-dependent regulator of chromatin subfamily A member 5